MRASDSGQLSIGARAPSVAEGRARGARAARTANYGSSPDSRSFAPSILTAGIITRPPETSKSTRGNYLVRPPPFPASRPRLSGHGPAPRRKKKDGEEGGKEERAPRSGRLGSLLSGSAACLFRFKGFRDSSPTGFLFGLAFSFLSFLYSYWTCRVGE